MNETFNVVVLCITQLIVVGSLFLPLVLLLFATDNNRQKCPLKRGTLRLVTVLSVPVVVAGNVSWWSWAGTTTAESSDLLCKGPSVPGSECQTIAWAIGDYTMCGMLVVAALAAVFFTARWIIIGFKK